MNLKTKTGKEVTSKFVGTGPSSYKKRIYWAAVSQMLRNAVRRYMRDSPFVASVSGSMFTTIERQANY
jgi:hypothetical protein